MSIKNSTTAGRNDTIAMDTIVIIGSSGHAKVVIDIVEQEGRYKIAGLVDRYRNPGARTLGYQVWGEEADLPSLAAKYALKGVIVAIGDNFIRAKEAARVREVWPTLPFVSAIHPKASIAKDVSVGEGSVIMAGVAVNPCCSIGRFCVLNTNCSLDHDSTMDDFSSLGPGATTGGNCRIGSYSAVGIGATLVHGIRIGEHTVIGAGTTTLGDIDSFKVAYGTPARAVRNREAGDPYF